MTYATVDQLEAWADFYAIELPYAPGDLPDPKVKLLELATHDVIRRLGFAWEQSELISIQRDALADACCVQALYRLQQGQEQRLDVDDGIASVGGVSFSVRRPARFSPEADEMMGGYALYARSHTVEPPVDAV